ncbi:hypothetical protein GCM10009798_01420 [Nocardioides panacihumi]|uniref:Polysaccharide biosynthesis protein C-terminal domain-containing protein n=2 Tax=Nocardioides panacihumi TaxID=400774 RepID=A0ABN2Q770_9ACTN
MILPFVVAPLIARDLGPAERGLYGSAIAGLALAPVLFGMGLPLAVRREAARGDGGAAIRTAMWICAAMLLPAVGIGFLVARHMLPGLTSVGIAAFAIACGSAVLQTFGLCLQGCLVIEHRYAAIAVVQIAQSATMSLGAAGLWFADRMTVASLLVVFVASILATVIAAAAAARVSLRGARARPQPLLVESVSYAGSQIAETGSNTLIPLLAVLVIGGRESGYLAVAMTIASLAAVLANTLGVLGYRDAATRTGVELAEFCALIVRISLASAGLFALAMACLTPLLISTLFGEEYRPAIGPALVAVAGSILYVLNFATSQLLAAQGRGWSMTAAQVGGLVVGVTVFAAGAGWAGALWGAIAVLICRVVTAVACLRSLPRGASSFIPRLNDLPVAARAYVRGLPADA